MNVKVTKKSKKDHFYLNGQSDLRPPTSQPEGGFIETANQKLPSIQNAPKSPDLERISAPDKEHSRGMIKIANQNWQRGANTVVFAGFIKIRGFYHGL